MPIFVVHEHWARRHHFDLRLEMDGVLKSWAVPKEIPLKPKIKRLAVQVDDHDLSYASFEGTIPEGSYGAGKVKIWDAGNFVLVELDKKKIAADFKGKKMRGKYALVNFRDKNWLLLKEK